ncbi:MAG: hypothetical protein WBC68_11610, partial [Albidovulum sp.]
TSVALSPDQINSTFGDASVILPGGKGPDSDDWPDHWPKDVLDSEEFYEKYHAWLKTLAPATVKAP